MGIHAEVERLCESLLQIHAIPVGASAWEIIQRLQIATRDVHLEPGMGANYRLDWNRIDHDPANPRDWRERQYGLAIAVAEWIGSFSEAERRFGARVLLLNRKAFLAAVELSGTDLRALANVYRHVPAWIIGYRYTDLFGNHVCTVYDGGVSTGQEVSAELTVSDELRAAEAGANWQLSRRGKSVVQVESAGVSTFAWRLPNYPNRVVMLSRVDEAVQLHLIPLLGMPWSPLGAETLVPPEPAPVAPESSPAEKPSPDTGPVATVLPVPPPARALDAPRASVEEGNRPQVEEPERSARARKPPPASHDSAESGPKTVTAEPAKGRATVGAAPRFGVDENGCEIREDQHPEKFARYLAEAQRDARAADAEAQRAHTKAWRRPTSQEGWVADEVAAQLRADADADQAPAAPRVRMGFEKRTYGVGEDGWPIYPDDS